MTNDELVDEWKHDKRTDGQIVALALLEVARAIKDLGFGNDIRSPGTLEFIGMQLRDVGGELVQAVHSIGDGATRVADAIEQSHP